METVSLLLILLMVQSTINKKMLEKEELCVLLPALSGYFITKQHQTQQQYMSSTYYMNYMMGKCLTC
eukprot:4080631-Ditylum_brightwellii.AAC.1